VDKKLKIYIAGHMGLVGSAVLKRLEELGYNNVFYKTKAELDLTKQPDIEKFFEEIRPEYVFLAAAKVGGILANDTYKAEFIYDNIMIGVNVIHSANSR
jgi:GDP-L-fucose synthase